MPVTSSPVWSAAQAGTVGNAGAIAGSAQINQLLTTHPDTTLYQGASILTPNGTGGSAWAEQFSTLDIDQPFTMSGTVIGRVAVPLLAVGNGADLLVSLCSDNSGAPGAMICQTRLPASWITQLSAVTSAPVPSADPPFPQYTNSPLAASQFYSFFSSKAATVAWSPPSGSDSSYIEGWNMAVSSNYLLLLGGATSGTSATVANTYSVAFGEAGNISAAIPQPSLPQPVIGNGSAVVQTDPASGTQTVFLIGGNTSSGGTILNTVYAAQFDPTVGTIGSWSAQATLPEPLEVAGVAAYGEYVYVLGGYTTGLTRVAQVLYAQVQNGQITAWNATTSLPSAAPFVFSTAVNGFLITGPGTGVPGSTFMYAPINANGSIGPWRNLPAGFTIAAAVFALGQFGILSGSTSVTPASMGFSANGPSPLWQEQDTVPAAELLAVSVGSGGGQWQAYSALNLSPGQFQTSQLNLTPNISVPLPATGLTNGATYHVLMQQQGGDLSDYLRTHYDVNAFPGNPTLLTSPPGTYTWTAATSGRAVPLQIFDQTVPYSGAKALHTWEDSGAKIATLVYATTPDQRFLGICEATRMGLAINANQGFEAGLAPWTVSGGTYDQSTAQSYAGLHSALITPSGSAASVSIASEIMPCMPGQSITVEGWFWFTNAVTATFSHSVVWYPTPTGGTPVSTSSSLVSVSAGTWTQEGGALTAPAGAYGFAMEPTLSGTPAASQLWYADDVIATCTYVGPQQSTVTAIEWSGTGWPSVGVPLGATELA